jgi:hypothetical protein
LGEVDMWGFPALLNLQVKPWDCGRRCVFTALARLRAGKSQRCRDRATPGCSWRLLNNARRMVTAAGKNWVRGLCGIAAGGCHTHRNHYAKRRLELQTS